LSEYDQVKFKPNSHLDQYCDFYVFGIWTAEGSAHWILTCIGIQYRSYFDEEHISHHISNTWNLKPSILFNKFYISII
jgi:hypothetical protein